MPEVLCAQRGLPEQLGAQGGVRLNFCGLTGGYAGTCVGLGAGVCRNCGGLREGYAGIFCVLRGGV